MKLKNLSIILVIVMILSVLPMSVSADVEDPYSQIKAATFDSSSTTANKNKGYGLAINASLSSWVCYKNVDFGDMLPYAAVVAIGIQDSDGWMDGNKVVLRLDSPTADPFCTIEVTECGGWSVPTENVGTITQKITGVHDVYMSSNKPNDIFYFYFNGKSAGETPYKPYDSTSAFADMKDKKYGYEVETMYGLGIIDEYKEGLFYPNLPILRGEFASWMARFMTDTIPNAQNNPFVDIDNCDYINEICYLYDNGILTLNSTKTFNPYDFMTVREASAMLLRFMNYGTMVEYKGGWPYGYDSLAREIGLTTGMASGDYLRRAPAAKMLYNAIDAEYLEASSIKNDDITYKRAKGILESTRNIYKAKGVVSATTLGGIAGEIDVQDGTCYIGTTKFNLSENVVVDHYLGVNCEYYYHSSDGGETKTLLYIAPTSKTDTTVLSGSDVKFSTITSELIKYTDKNDKEKKINLKTSVNWIYNHRALDRNIETVVTDPQKFKGNIRLVDNGNGYETVFVEDYRNIKVGSFNSVTNVMVDALSGDTWNLKDKKVIISDGTQNLKANKLSRDMLLELYESADKDIVVMLVGESKVTGYASEITTDKTVVIGNSEYGIANEFVGTPELGATMNFFINRHNEIVYTESADTTKLVGLLFDLYEDKDDKATISLITGTDKKEDFKVASKIFIDGFSVKKYDDMKAKLSGASQFTPVLYRLNEMGEITMLDTPLTGARTADDTLTFLKNGSYLYRGSLGCLLSNGNELYPVKSGAKWLVPRSVYGNGADYRFASVGNLPGQFRAMDLYSFERNGEIAELLVSSTAHQTGQDTIGVFKNYVSTVDANGNPGLKLTVITPGGSEKEFFIAEGSMIRKDVENTGSATVDGVAYVKRLKKGDVIRFGTDTYGDVLAIEVHVFANGATTNGTDTARLSSDGTAKIGMANFDYTYLYGTVKDIKDGYLIVKAGAADYWFTFANSNDVVMLTKEGELKKSAVATNIKVGDKVYVDVQGTSLKMVVLYEQ